jgi:hypothetical protein
MGAYKGHAHYDEYDSLEKLLKELIDLHKDILGYVYKLTYDFPVLGPILGPSTSCFTV